MATDIDFFSRRRRIVLATSGIAFLAFQEIFFVRLDEPISAWRGIHYATAFAYVAWAANLIVILATGLFLFPRTTAATRLALNDELTAANRRFAYRAGYWMVMGTIPILYAMYQFGQVSVPEVLRLLFAFGVAMPAVAFAGKERKQGA